jgi:hypothetical protein
LCSRCLSASCLSAFLCSFSSSLVENLMPSGAQRCATSRYFGKLISVLSPCSAAPPCSPRRVTQGPKLSKLVLHFIHGDLSSPCRDLLVSLLSTPRYLDSDMVLDYLIEGQCQKSLISKNFYKLLTFLQNS